MNTLDRVPRNLMLLSAMLTCVLILVWDVAAWSSKTGALQCGNIDGDSLNVIGVEDATPLLQYIYFDSALPVPNEIADVNLCPPVDISDLTYMNRFIFQSGTAPCSSVAICSSIVGGLISLDSVSGSPVAGSIQAGVPVAFWMTITNLTNINVTGSCNGFVISSPDGAEWWPTLRADTIMLDPPPMLFVDSMWYDPLLDPTEYPILDWVQGANSIYSSVEVRTEANRGPGAVNPPQMGQGSDTVFVIGSTMNLEFGLFAGFDSPALVFRVDSVSQSSVGKTICLDSVSILARDRWKWAGWTGSEAIDLYPEWVGAACFNVLSCCQGIRGNINLDPQDTIDISDLTSLVGWMFKSGSAPPCLLEADVDGSGDHDIADVTYLVGYMFKGGPEPAGCP